jgi:DNA-binding transcriptional MerR regulator
VSKEPKSFKSRYSIRDMEKLSGIQAHTLRIWEKRYNLFAPLREGNNIRYYSSADAQKLLNIATLYHLGYKISHIAGLPDADLLAMVQRESKLKPVDTPVLQAFKMAMLTFNEQLFHETLRSVSETKSLTEIFRTYFIPLLRDAGQLWQIETISVAHEHFISNLVRQKLICEIGALPPQPVKTGKKVFVLFLLSQEIHELSLLYAHYEILRHGHTSIFLGQSVPFKSLQSLHEHFDSICFMTHLTVEPTEIQLETYLTEFSQKILRTGIDGIWVSGRNIEMEARLSSIPDVHYLYSPDDLLGML